MAGTILPAISFALNLSTFSMEYMDALKFCGDKTSGFEILTSVLMNGMLLNKVQQLCGSLHLGSKQKLTSLLLCRYSLPKQYTGTLAQSLYVGLYMCCVLWNSDGTNGNFTSTLKQLLKEETRDGYVWTHWSHCFHSKPMWTAKPQALCDSLIR